MTIFQLERGNGRVIEEAYILKNFAPNSTALVPLFVPSVVKNTKNNDGLWKQPSVWRGVITGILSGNERIAFLFDSYYDLDRNLLLKNAGKDWNYFYISG